MISDFQWALVGIAVLIIILVIVYNRWQEAKYKKHAEHAFASDHRDVLLHEPADRLDRVEPQLGTLPRGGSSDDDLMGFDSPKVEAPIRPASAADGRLPGINPEIDTVALLLADSPISPDQFWPTVQQSQRISKRIIWEGLVGGLWQPIDAHNADDGDGYRELRAGLQLAARNGPVDINTLHGFNEMMIAFSQSIGAVSQREDVTLATARSQTVDAFCADTDIEIAINVIGKSGGTFATTKVRGLAESSGLTALDSGEYELRDELGHTLFTLRNMSADEPPGIKHAGTYLTGLTFALDVPRAPQPASVFARMMTLALRFADTLQGDVVDDNRKLLTANGRTAITETIGSIAEEMQSKGVVPGSSAALRLYS
ncbi:MAG: cell division protein ZipA C-terminal FtsZ-binding domain-containing protein [Usitatibacteraceae bacterium]